nr:flagellar hook-length control protein FliK [Dissulfurirhabdus thermomarina]
MIVVSLPADPPPVIPETPADGGGPVPAPAPPLPGAGAAAAALQSAPPAGEPAQEDAAPGPARADTGVPVRAAGPAPTAAPAQPVAPDGAPPSTAAPEPPPAAPDGDPEKAPAAGDRPGDGGKKTLHAHGGPVTAESAATKRQPGPEERPAAAGPRPAASGQHRPPAPAETPAPGRTAARNADGGSATTPNWWTAETAEGQARPGAVASTPAPETRQAPVHRPATDGPAAAGTDLQAVPHARHGGEPRPDGGALLADGGTRSDQVQGGRANGATARPAAFAAVLQQIGDGVTRAIRLNQHRAVLHLDPPELGRVRVEIVVRHNHEVQATFLAEHPEVRHLVEHNLAHLRTQLAQGGFDLAQCHVGVDSGDGRFAFRGGRSGAAPRPSAGTTRAAGEEPAPVAPPSWRPGGTRLNLVV